MINDWKWIFGSIFVKVLRNLGGLVGFVVEGNNFFFI